VGKGDFLGLIKRHASGPGARLSLYAGIRDVCFAPMADVGSNTGLFRQLQSIVDLDPKGASVSRWRTTAPPSAQRHERAFTDIQKADVQSLGA
jgi:hypothetical protein